MEVCPTEIELRCKKHNEEKTMFCLFEMKRKCPKCSERCLTRYNREEVAKILAGDSDSDEELEESDSQEELKDSDSDEELEESVSKEKLKDSDFDEELDAFAHTCVSFEDLIKEQTEFIESKKKLIDNIEFKSSLRSATETWKCQMNLRVKTSFNQLIHEIEEKCEEVLKQIEDQVEENYKNTLKNYEEGSVKSQAIIDSLSTKSGIELVESSLGGEFRSAWQTLDKIIKENEEAVLTMKTFFVEAEMINPVARQDFVSDQPFAARKGPKRTELDRELYHWTEAVRSIYSDDPETRGYRLDSLEYNWENMSLEQGLDLTDFDGKMLKLVGEMLARTKLERIDLSKNELGEGYQEYFPLMKSNKTLISINLSENGLDDDSCDELVDWLKHDKVLESINLSKNRLGPEWCEKLAEVLQVNTTLKEIDLSGNKYLLLGYLARALVGNTSVERIIVDKPEQSFSESGAEMEYLDPRGVIMYQ